MIIEIIIHDTIKLMATNPIKTNDTTFIIVVTPLTIDFIPSE